MSTPVILDVDTGIDDAMAIMFAVKTPALDVKAISCVAGNTSLENVVANTLKILDVVGAGDIPVAGGALRPLLEHARDASYVHGADGMGGLDLPPSRRAVSPVHSVELMRRTLAESPVPMTIIALAPLTNIALLLRMHPEVADRIERIVFMGGSAAIGNASAVAEFNIWHDPEAAAVVVDAGLPMTMYGLDVFDTVAFGQDRISAFLASDEPVAHVLGGLLQFRVQAPGGPEGYPFSLIGDAGAVCAAVAPQLMAIERDRPLAIQLSGPARGQTIVDRRDHAGEDAIHGDGRAWPVADVVMSADIPAVLDLFAATLGV